MQLYFILWLQPSLIAWSKRHFSVLLCCSAGHMGPRVPPCFEMGIIFPCLRPCVCVCGGGCEWKTGPGWLLSRCWRLDRAWHDSLCVSGGVELHPHRINPMPMVLHHCSGATCIYHQQNNASIQGEMAHRFQKNTLAQVNAVVNELSTVRICEERGVPCAQPLNANMSTDTAVTLCIHIGL